MNPDEHLFVSCDQKGGHLAVIGGMTVLERRLRDACKAGAKRATVTAKPVPLPADLTMDVSWVEPGTPPPVGATVVPGNECAGIAVEDDASRLRAEWALCRSLSKTHQGPTDALINRHMSQRITRWLSRTSIRPNHVTLVAGVVGLAASASLLFGQGWLGAWTAIAVGGVLLQLQSVLDSCDGELARLTWRFSKFGQWLDNISDDILDNLFILAAGYAAGGPWFIVGLAGAGARLATTGLAYVEVYMATGTGDLYRFRFWFQKGKETVEEAYDPTSVFTWLRALARRDTYVFIWMVACLAGAPQVVAVYGAGLGAILVVLCVLHMTLRERPATERAS